MKVELKKCYFRDFYDEFLYVSSKWQKIKKNPRKKVYKLTSALIVAAFFMFVFLILSCFLYLKYKELIFPIFIGVCWSSFVYILAYLNNINKIIDMYTNDNNVQVMNINDKCVEYFDEKKSIMVKWDDIACVVINKYSISFIPKTIFGFVISVSINNKDDIVKAIKKANRDSLLIDNNKS